MEKQPLLSEVAEDYDGAPCRASAMLETAMGARDPIGDSLGWKLRCPATRAATQQLIAGGAGGRGYFGDLGGGHCRTRTCDLVRVKHAL